MNYPFNYFYGAGGMYSPIPDHGEFLLEKGRKDSLQSWCFFFVCAPHPKEQGASCVLVGFLEG